LKPYKMRKECYTCKDSTIHSTGSTIWLSCKFKDGWFSTEAYCDILGHLVETDILDTDV
jgi:hypothetical protein